MIAGDGSERSGMYVMKEAPHLEIASLETHRPARVGGPGDMSCASFFRPIEGCGP